MHSITILTLVFLPGTFLAVRFLAPSFSTRCSSDALRIVRAWSSSGPPLSRPTLQTVFGSGLLNWDENGSGWATRMPGVRLFLAICLPMTTVTLVVWLVWTWRSQRRQRAYFGRLMEADRMGPVGDEKV